MLQIKLFRPIIITLTFLLVWQILIILTHIPAYLLPSPAQVLQTLFQQRLLIVHETLPTLIEMLSGFFFALLFGSLFAINLILFRRLQFWLLPILLISQALPLFALAPLFVVWLGYGMSSKIFTTAFMLFFPIASNFYDGLKNTHSDWLDLGKIFQISTFQSLLRIRIPAALPQFASGLRIAAVGAPLGAVLGEWVGSSQGLGFLMLNANARLQIDVVFAALIVIVLLSLGMYFSVDFILKKIIFWEEI